MGDEHETLKTSEALLRSARDGMRVAHNLLETKAKELAAKNEEYKVKIEHLKGKNNNINQMEKERASLKSELDKTKEKLKEEIAKNGEIVKSLEMIENQNAINTQNSSIVM